MSLAFPKCSNMSMMSNGKCSLAKCNGVSCSRICRDSNCLRKDWFRRFWCGIHAHYSASFSFLRASANFLASSANGRKHLGCVTYNPSRVCIGVFMYPSQAVIPRMSSISYPSSCSWIQCTSLGVMPRTGWMDCMGVVVNDCWTLTTFNGEGVSWLSMDVGYISEGCKKVKSWWIKASHISCWSLNSADVQSSVKTGSSCCISTGVLEESSGWYSIVSLANVMNKNSSDGGNVCPVLWVLAVAGSWSCLHSLTK